jgi:hypothetical protein
MEFAFWSQEKRIMILLPTSLTRNFRVFLEGLLWNKAGYDRIGIQRLRRPIQKRGFEVFIQTPILRWTTLKI